MRFFRWPLSLVAVLSVLFFTGCNESEATILYQLTISEDSAVFDEEGGVQTIAVMPFPENENWTASGSDTENWFSIECSPTTLKVIAEPNYSTDPRSGTIILSSPESRLEPYQIRVCQEASEMVELSANADTYSFDSEGGEYTFTVDCNCPWTIVNDSEWLSAESEGSTVTVRAGRNESEEPLSATVTIKAGEGTLAKSVDVTFSQGIRADNPYYKLLGQWEIVASKWYYSPNGSLNSLDYNPSPTQYYLIFDMEEGEYGKSYIMRNFLYPDTALEVRYDRETGSIVIPFGWTVFSYDVFLYITLVGSSSFSFASLEVDAVPSEDYSLMTLKLPAVDGFNYVGFGLWTYNEDGEKVALGSRSYPTMFPMGPIEFKKQ